MLNPKSIKVHEKDNVAVALEDLVAGDLITIDNQTIQLKADIPQGHKVALSAFRKGDTIIKYASVIGSAIQAVAIGEHVHSHNFATNLDENLAYTYKPDFKKTAPINSHKTILAYPRKNGDVGIRNELWIIPTVGCVNGQARQIIDQLKAETNTDHLDAIEVLSHQYGCSQLGDDHENTKKALAAAIKHPNAGGVLVLGLGCENNQISQLKEQLGVYDNDRVKFLVAQDVDDEIEVGLKLVLQLSENMKGDQRVEVPISKLKVGLKCGGSDGFSGITANPLLGAFSDWLIANGGSTVLTEVPEMFGAETNLMERALDKTVYTKIVDLINGFKDYFRRHNQVIYENPSPGNKAGGITTLEEKSLGATQKGGEAPIVDVIGYGEPISKSGLNLLWGPGNDLVSSSALGMSGCQMVLFTTGRGTPFGSFVPTLKVATNEKLYHKKRHWMDYNAGKLLSGKSKEEVLTDFSDFIIAVANGKQLKHEQANFKEIAIFKSGVTL